MNFTVFSSSPIPDIATARHNFNLHDLSDKDVAKVLFHQRKQQTGKSEILTWNQQSIAAVSILKYQEGDISFSNYSLASESEASLLGHFTEAFEDDGPVLSWNMLSEEIPLIRFRMLKNDVQHAFLDNAFQAALTSMETDLIDLSKRFSLSEATDRQLSDLALRFYLSGMQDKTVDSVWAAQLKAGYDEVTSYCAYKTLNTFLLAVEYFSMRDKISIMQKNKINHTLSQKLEASAHDYSGFLQQWKQVDGS